MLLKHRLAIGSDGMTGDQEHTMMLHSMSQFVLEDTGYLAMSLSNLIPLNLQQMTSDA